MKESNKIFTFILVAFGFSWLLWIPDALAENQIINLDSEHLIRRISKFGAWGPLIGMLFCSFFFEGWKSTIAKIKESLKLKNKKIGLLALLIFPLLLGTAILSYIIASGNSVSFTALTEPAMVIIAIPYIFFLGGPLQEEFGWRGYLFDKLDNQFSSLLSGAIAGFVWGLWHLPLFYIPREEFYYNKPMWGLFLTTILVGIILAWLFKRSNKSVLVVLIAHTMFNWSNFTIPVLAHDGASLILFGLFIGFVIWIIAKYDINDFEPRSKTKSKVNVNLENDSLLLTTKSK